MIRRLLLLPLAWLLLAGSCLADAQQVDFLDLFRYGESCTKLKAAILSDIGKELGIDDHAIEWISECNGSDLACPYTRDAITKVKKASPLDCLGYVLSREAASAAYSLYSARIGELPKCIAQRC